MEKSEIDAMITEECSKASAYFATVSAEKIWAIRSMALFLSRQKRESKVERAVQVAIAKTADKYLAA